MSGKVKEVARQRLKSHGNVPRYSKTWFRLRSDVWDRGEVLRLVKAPITCQFDGLTGYQWANSNDLSGLPLELLQLLLFLSPHRFHLVLVSTLTKGVG